jgi:hypothetical protein
MFHMWHVILRRGWGAHAESGRLNVVCIAEPVYQYCRHRSAALTPICQSALCLFEYGISVRNQES